MLAFDSLACRGRRRGDGSYFFFLFFFFFFFSFVFVFFVFRWWNNRGCFCCVPFFRFHALAFWKDLLNLNPFAMRSRRSPLRVHMCGVDGL